MAQPKLFIANLPPIVTEDQLRAVCEPYGPVRYVRVFSNKPAGKARVSYQAQTPVEPILAALNAHRWGEQRMRVSPMDPQEDPPALTGEQQQLVQQLVTQLQEEEAPEAIAIIERLVQHCGAAFAEGLLADTEEIEAAGGLWLADYNRRRTTGGVYLFLARGAVSYPMRQVLFPPPPTEKKEAALPPVENAPQPDRPQPAASSAGEAVTLQQQLATLQRAHQEAQAVLVAVKAGQSQVSPMVAMKAIVETRRVLDEFLRQHPALG